MSDSGSPMWLLKFPRLRITRYRAARNSAVTSFVVVFPALPVIATTFAPDSRRTACASACSAAVVSSTSMTTGAADVPPGRRRGARCRATSLAPVPRGTTTPPAPAASAAAANSAPSNRSPRIATNSSPAPSVRVSIETPANSRAAISRHQRRRPSPRPPSSRSGAGRRSVPARAGPRRAYRCHTTPEFVRRRASASRATATSSNGSTRSPIT